MTAADYAAAAAAYGVIHEPGFDAALDAGDRGALLPYADWLRDHGDDDGADCLQWAAANDVWPNRGYWSPSRISRIGAALFSEILDKDDRVRFYSDFARTAGAVAFIRLRSTWASLSPADRPQTPQEAAA